MNGEIEHGEHNNLGIFLGGEEEGEQCILREGGVWMCVCYLNWLFFNGLSACLQKSVCACASPWPFF